MSSKIFNMKTAIVEATLNKVKKNLDVKLITLMIQIY